MVPVTIYRLSGRLPYYLSLRDLTVDLAVSDIRIGRSSFEHGGQRRLSSAILFRWSGDSPPNQQSLLDNRFAWKRISLDAYDLSSVGVIKFYSHEKSFGFISSVDGTDFYFTGSTLSSWCADHVSSGDVVLFSIKSDENVAQRMFVLTKRARAGSIIRRTRAGDLIVQDDEFDFTLLARLSSTERTQSERAVGLDVIFELVPPDSELQNAKPLAKIVEFATRDIIGQEHAVGSTGNEAP